MSTKETTSLGDAIVALATPPGAGAIALIRVSGQGCLDKLLPFLFTTQAKNLVPLISEQLPERTLKLVTIKDPTRLNILDDGLVVFFKGPRSFTGEDAAELQVHGGRYNVQMIMAALLHHGFRLAEPGEFSKRAYLNGKIDLTTAEGIRSLVEADSQQEWLAARQLASGVLAKHIESLRLSLIEAISLIEAQVDFPDEGDTSHLNLQDVDIRVSKVLEDSLQLKGTYQSGQVASSGLKVVLLGEPNAGKSTLMNTLLQRDRSLVTELPGTTRDYLEEKCLIYGRLIRLFDLAGIRKADDPVEALGVLKAQEIAKTADLTLILSPSQETFNPNLFEEWIPEFAAKNKIYVFTKADLGVHPTVPDGALKISCHTGLGLEDLKKTVVNLVDSNLQGLSEEQPFITDIRHFHSLEHAIESIQGYQISRANSESIEILGAHLRYAAQDLLSIIGQVETDDILDYIFGKFCIGK